MINSLSIALSGLGASVKNINVAASNIANAGTTGSLEEGGQAPYTPLTARHTAQSVGHNGQGAGVSTHISARANPFVPAFDPDSPFADENGIIGVPHVDLAEETVNVLLAETSFKANLETIKASEEQFDELLGIFDEEV